MSYTPTTWVEDVTTLGPTNLNHLEAGVQAAAAVADAAIPKPTPPADASILYYDAGTGTWKGRLLVDADVSGSAAIAKTKLAALNIVNADVAAGAGIAYSKLANASNEGKVLASNSTLGIVARGGITFLANPTIGSPGTFDVQSIPSIYAGLMIFFWVRSAAAVVTDDILMRFNNDAGSNYDDEILIASAASVTSAEELGVARAKIAACPGASAPANLVAYGCITIWNMGALFGEHLCWIESVCKVGTTSGSVTLRKAHAAWRSTAQIDRIQIFPAGGNFAISSSLTIYGIAQ